MHQCAHRGSGPCQLQQAEEDVAHGRPGGGGRQADARSASCSLPRALTGRSKRGLLLGFPPPILLPLPSLPGSCHRLCHGPQGGHAGKLVGLVRLGLGLCREGGEIGRRGRYG